MTAKTSTSNKVSNKSNDEVIKSRKPYEKIIKADDDVEAQYPAENSIPEDIIEAAKLSNAHDFIVQFTNGYNTDVGEGSIMVSGGQKQRIAIAR